MEETLKSFPSASDFSFASAAKVNSTDSSQSQNAKKQQKSSDGKFVYFSFADASSEVSTIPYEQRAAIEILLRRGILPIVKDLIVNTPIPDVEIQGKS